MKRFLLIVMILAIVLLVTNFAITNSIGKKTEVLAFNCNGNSAYSNLYGGAPGIYDYDANFTILITAKSYPWENQKKYNIDFHDSSGREFQLSTEDKSDGNESNANFTENRSIINNLNLYFYHGFRQIHNDDNWTLNSERITFEFNIVNMATKIKIERGHMSGTDQSYSTYELRGKCSKVNLL